MGNHLKKLALVASLAAATAAHAATAPSFTIFNNLDLWKAAVAKATTATPSVVYFTDGTSGPDFSIASINTFGVTVFSISGGVVNDYDYKYNSTSYHFNNGIIAFGGNWNLSPENPGSGLTLSADGATVGNIASTYEGGFYGFVSNTPFTTLSITMGPERTKGEHYTVDDVRYAAPVPEPETYAMLVAGLGILGAFARRRKQKD